MTYRNYEPERDRDAAHRIWHEVGWSEKGKEEGLDRYIGACRAIVGEIYGEPECLVLSTMGTVRYLKEDLPLACVMGVTTSHVARKQGLASRMAAQIVAMDAADGVLVSGLGMFEQGFYNQIGFGTGGYEIILSFDPAQLQLPTRARPPRRLSTADWETIHAARLARWRGHGGCNITPAAITRTDLEGMSNAFTLGYFDGPDGTLSHFMTLGAQEREQGPYRVQWMVYRTPEQFLELMALLRNLGDQVRSVRMAEPAGIQLQDLLRQPFRFRALTEKTKFEARTHAVAYWQMRICDLPGCLAQTHLRGETARFHLRLTDPIERFLDADSPWCGIGGDYIVTLGPESHAERGETASLPTLTASVGAFTRLWLGVRPATGLAVTDELSGPPELLEQLDWTLRLPSPKPDWDF